MCGALHYHARKQRPYDLPIQAFLELHRSVWRVVERTRLN